MKNINSYMLEKLHIKKGMNNDTYTIEYISNVLNDEWAVKKRLNEFKLDLNIDNIKQIRGDINGNIFSLELNNEEEFTLALIIISYLYGVRSWQREITSGDLKPLINSLKKGINNFDEIEKDINKVFPSAEEYIKKFDKWFNI